MGKKLGFLLVVLLLPSFVLREYFGLLAGACWAGLVSVVYTVFAPSLMRWVLYERETRTRQDAPLPDNCVPFREVKREEDASAPCGKSRLSS